MIPPETPRAEHEGMIPAYKVEMPPSLESVDVTVQNETREKAGIDMMVGPISLFAKEGSLQCGVGD